MQPQAGLVLLGGEDGDPTCHPPTPQGCTSAPLLLKPRVLRSTQGGIQELGVTGLPKADTHNSSPFSQHLTVYRRP